MPQLPLRAQLKEKKAIWLSVSGSDAVMLWFKQGNGWPTAPVDRINEAVWVAPTGQGPTEKWVQQRLACQTVVSLVQFRGSLKGDDFFARWFSPGSIRKVQSDAATSCKAQEAGDGVELGFNWFVWLKIDGKVIGGLMNVVSKSLKFVCNIGQTTFESSVDAVKLATFPDAPEAEFLAWWVCKWCVIVSHGGCWIRMDSSRRFAAGRWGCSFWLFSWRL